jgi:sec-independent protein translocase protein TatA
MNTLLALGSLGTPEIIFILILGVLLFGRRLPEVGRYLGKGIVEFKKGLKGLEDEVEMHANNTARPDQAALEPPRPPQRIVTNVPKFEDNAGAVSTPPQVQG